MLVVTDSLAGISGKELTRAMVRKAILSSTQDDSITHPGIYTTEVYHENLLVLLL